MNILMITPWFYPDSVGGTEVYVLTLANEMKSRGFNVKVATPSQDESEHGDIYKGLEIFRYPIPYFEVFSNWLERERPDIVHMHSVTPGSGLLHARCVKKLGIPLVLTIHIPDTICARGTMMRWGKLPCDGKINPYRCAPCYLQKQGLPRFIASALSRLPFQGFSGFLGETNRLRTALEMKKIIAAKNSDFQNLCSLSDRIVAVSKWLYDALGQNKSILHKLSLSRHGLAKESVKPKRLSGRKSGETVRIGYIGRFNPVKGVHVLIEAVKRLPANFPVSLALYGRANGPEEKAYLSKLKESSHNANHVFFGGELNDENRAEIFDSLDAVAVPSVWLETGPLVVLEAQARKIPVIGSNIGGIAELVSDGINGMLVRTGDVKAWQDAIKKISLQPALLKALARNAPPVRTSADVAEEMAALYSQPYMLPSASCDRVGRPIVNLVNRI